MEKTAQRTSPATACKERVAAIRAKLPKNVRLLIMDKYSEYNTGTGSILINNVLAGRSADLKLTEILEKIAAEQEGGDNE